jgi:hypothetical protein
MNVKTNALSDPAGYGSWQQIRESDKPNPEESPDDREMAMVGESVPKKKAECRRTWQQVRATDATESATSS